MSERLPEPKHFGEASLLIFDEVLRKVVPDFEAFAEGFAQRYGVEAGEQLKDLDLFAGRMREIVGLVGKYGTQKIHIVSAGGGSVGDFSGFVASVLKRGVRLSHLPTTWLSAIDSSHGGKTALNVGGIKNQIGTFYPAEKVFLIRNVLLAQGESRAAEAMGEAAKAALIAGGGLWESEGSAVGGNENRWLWENLERLIETKMWIVGEDPYDRTGIRARLNLGHTIGHVLEAHCGVAHGIAVGAGLFFALAMGEASGRLSDEGRRRMAQKLREKFGLRGGATICPCIDKGRFEELLLMDKKRDEASTMMFVYVDEPGKVIAKATSVELIMAVAQAEGLCR